MSSNFYASLLHVCSYLGYGELIVVLTLSSAARETVGVAVADRANRLLAHWLDPPGRFWTMLEDAAGAIAGSFVLRLLDNAGDPWLPGSLDIYVPWKNSAGVSRLVGYLRKRRYHLWTTDTFPHISRPADRDTPPTSEALVVGGYHEGVKTSGGTEKIIRIFFVTCDDALEGIPMTWTTANVNFLTTDLLVCAYPHSTFQHRGFVSSLQWGSMDHYALVTISDRGYRIHDFDGVRPDGQPRDHGHRYDPRAPRSFGDGECMRISIPRRALSPVLSLGPVYPSREVASAVTWQFGALNFIHFSSHSSTLPRFSSLWYLRDHH